MTIYTRPRNLTEDQKKQRRKDSNLRHRMKYSEQLKEKRNRKRRVEKLLEGKQVGVQTPDWDAEAREAASTATAALVTQISLPVDPQTTVSTTSEPSLQTRTRGRTKQG